MSRHTRKVDWAKEAASRTDFKTDAILYTIANALTGSNIQPSQDELDDMASFGYINASRNRKWDRNALELCHLACMSWQAINGDDDPEDQYGQASIDYDAMKQLLPSLQNAPNPKTHSAINHLVTYITDVYNRYYTANGHAKPDAAV